MEKLTRCQRRIGTNPNNGMAGNMRQKTTSVPLLAKLTCPHNRSIRVAFCESLRQHAVGELLAQQSVARLRMYNARG